MKAVVNAETVLQRAKKIDVEMDGRYVPILTNISLKTASNSFKGIFAGFFGIFASSDLNSSFK